jgi:hypothetical protein
LTSVIEHVDAAAPDAKRPPFRRRRRSCSWLVSDEAVGFSGAVRPV